MGRPISVRTNYREDGAHLLRFESAILKDEGLPEKWRRDFASQTHQLAIRSLQADDIKRKNQKAKK